MDTRIPDYDFSIAGVPDIDQRCVGLPGGGEAYCVPTATTNWLYYLAAHGRPAAIWVQPPNPTIQPLTVMNLLRLGSYMSTDASNGTQSGDWFEGLSDWSDDRKVPAMFVQYCVSEGNSITFETLQRWVGFHGLITVGMGRYTKSGTRYSRTSGHAMTVVALHKSAGVCRIVVHNPAEDDGDPMKQSAVVDSSTQVVNQAGNFEGSNATLIRWDSSTDPYRFVDQCVIILPPFAITSVSGRSLTHHMGSLTSDAVQTREIPLGLGADIVDLAIHPAFPVVALLVQGTGDVVTVDLAGGAPRKIASLPGAAWLTWGGRSMRLFVAQGHTVVAYDETGKELGRTALDQPIDALSFDHKEDRLVVASSSAGKLLYLQPTLEVQLTHDLPVIAGEGRLSLSTNSRDGTLCVTRAGSPQVATLRLHPTGAVALGTSRMLATGVTAAAHVDRGGVLYVSENQKIATFDVDGNRVTGSPFAGLAAGPLLKVARSYSNADPARMSQPGWRNGPAG